MQPLEAIWLIEKLSVKVSYILSPEYYKDAGKVQSLRARQWNLVKGCPLSSLQGTIKDPGKVQLLGARLLVKLCVKVDHYHPGGAG
jgi:hypothetical protein